MKRKRRGTDCPRCCANSRSTRWPSRPWRCYIEFLVSVSKTPAEIHQEMVIGTPLQHPHRNAGRGRALSRILALTVIFILVGRSSSQQSTPSRNNARPTSNTSSPFLEAETLLRQGSVEEAKQRIEEQLKLNPSSVEGYNLLGIAYSSEKDYDNALKALQQALTLDPNSTRTHNNLGNLYVSQEKVDLAENEFGKVLRVDPTNREANYNLGLVLMARH